MSTVGRSRPPARRSRGRGFTLAHAAERLERHRVVLGLLVLALSAFLTYLSIVAINGIPFSNPQHFRVVLPASGPILARGDDVLIAGQRVGEVRSVAPLARARAASITVDAGTAIGRDASARIRLRGLAGATYLELFPGSRRQRARSGFTIPVSRTSTNTELTDVIASFDAASRQAMGRTLNAYGAGIAGRGSSVNQALADLPPLLTGLRPLLAAFSPAPGQLSGFVHELDRTTVGLAGLAPGDLGALLSAFRLSTDAILSARQALGAGIDALRPFSDEVQATLPIADPVLRDASAAARSLDPTVGALQQALPSLDSLLGRAADVAQLSRLARALDPVLLAAGPALTQLWPAAASLAPLAGAVAPLASYAAAYPQEILAGPTGFTTWGGFHYDLGVARGARAVRFAPVLTCSPGRDPYPAPGQAARDHKACPSG
ncbi:MAG: MlaD family protein [Solirubrobacteraceae bacterium]